MAVVVTRPLAGYTSTSTIENAEKYQQDSALVTAISSEKVDGDINRLVDAVNTVASFDGGTGTTALSTTLTNFNNQITQNANDIATLVSGTIPDGDKGDITVSSSGSVWTVNNDAITNAKIATGAVDSAELAADSVITTKIADLAVTNAKLADSSVSTTKYVDNSITAVKLTDNSVTTNKINDDAVTLAKMSSGTAGNLISYDASGDPVAVATGTAGQVLTSNGAGLPPTMQDSPIQNASTTVKGVVEIATDAEVTAETATGGTGASLVATPANMKKHQGVAKAWVNINNSDAIVDDYNISSLTDFGVSGYTLNFTNAMANTNYIVVGSGNIANNGSTLQCGIYSSDDTIGTPVTKTTSAVRVNVVEVNSNTHLPWLNTSFAIFGD